jgi:hypothetical protein
MRSHLEAVYRQTGHMPKVLADIPKMPDELTYLWDWFCDLDSARGGNGFGLNPLSYAEIRAWADLTRVQPDPWEIETLRRIDSVRIRIANEQTKGST